MRACLKCFVFLLQDAILRLEISGLKEYEKIIELAKKIAKKINIDELAKKFEEDFFDNGFSLNDISPSNFTYYILSKFRNQDLLKDISYELKKTEKCQNCGHEKFSSEKHYIIHFNKEDIENSKENIKDIFKKFNKDKGIKSLYKAACTHCKMEKEMVKTTKYINLPKYLIIFIENGFRFSKSNADNLDNFEVGIEEGFDNKNQ